MTTVEMTTVAEIARAADVSVEDVLRVLNRDDVGEDIGARVISAMDDYGYSRLPRPEAAAGSEAPRSRSPEPRAVVGEVVDDNGTPNPQADALGRARAELLQAVGDVVDELENPETLELASDPLGIDSLADRIRVMDARFEGVARDLEGMKRELARARSERSEDLALLVDLLTTSWRAADRRLARIDRKLERM